MKVLTNHQTLSNLSPKFLENASHKHFLDSVIDGGPRERNQTLDKFCSNVQFNEGRQTCERFSAIDRDGGKWAQGRTSQHSRRGRGQDGALGNGVELSRRMNTR